MVYEVIIPNSHSTIKITQIVHIIISSTVRSVSPCCFNTLLNICKNIKNPPERVFYSTGVLPLFYNQIVLHFFDVLNASGNLSCLDNALRRINKTA
jgi:hypothetical protein